MDLIANDLSIEGQFTDVPTLRASFSVLMAMRKVAREWDRELYCNKAMVNAKPMPCVPMAKAVGQLPIEQRRAVMAWLTRGGPFWDDASRHGPDEWLEVDSGEVVTDTAVAEAAFRTLNGVPTSLVSIAPSRWTQSPVPVTWRWNDDRPGEPRIANVENWWDADALRTALEDAAPPLTSWNQLREVAERRFSGLVFGKGCFDPLAGVPFAKGAADRLALCFDILQRLASCYDEGDTQEAEQLKRQYFHGDKALFSDSSKTEKQKFKQELTFPHPADPNQKKLFGWHGKMRRHLIRFHFSWPIKANEPVYVVYVGPKLTKK